MVPRGVWVLGLIVLFYSLHSFSQTQIDIDDLKAPWLEIYPAGLLESKPIEKPLIARPFGEIPQGKITSPTPNECSSLELERLLSQNTNPQIQSQVTQSFFTRCEKKFNSFAPEKYMALLKHAAGKYTLNGYDNLREVILKLPYKTVIHGLLALKDLEKPRPMLIIICGSAVNLNQPAARVFLSHIFDTSPFNVLILPSISGTDFIRDNNGFGIGGFEEGRQTFEVVRLLGRYDSPFRKIISSFHVLGASLGGNGALFTSAYGSYNNDTLRGPKIQSVSAICPVVDLKASLEKLDRNDFTGRHFTGLILSAVIGNFVNVFGTDTEIPMIYKPGHKKSIPFLEKVFLPRYKVLSRQEDFQLPPFSQFDLDSADTFWKANNFLNYYSRVTVPTFLIYSEDDFVVDSRPNGMALETALKVNPNPLVNVMHLKHGAHCAAAEVYGENIFDGAIRNFVLTHSPEFNFQLGRQRLQLSDAVGKDFFQLEKDEKFFGYNWKIEKNGQMARADLKVWQPHLRTSEIGHCSDWSPYYASIGCFRNVSVHIPLTRFFNLPKGNSDFKTQSQQLTRWLNSRARILTASGNEPVDTRDIPATIEFTTD